MASSSSEIPISSSPPATPQAGPLPAKRGEVGWNEGIHGAAEQGRSPTATSPEVSLPARHPADRDHPDDENPPPPTSPSASPNTSNDSAPSPDNSSETNSSMQRRHFLKFLGSKDVPTYGGLRLTTLVVCLLQTFFLVGTITGWIVTIRMVNTSSTSQAQQMAGASSSIFIHVVFAIAVLGQLVFLERRIFVLRAQRYSHKNPGQVLPTTRFGLGSDPGVGWAPWNRPPLPTYAAALAQSGVGTGDVEDHIIAQPPPPAYGNTRGSTLVLQGFLTDIQRSQRPVSTRSRLSERSSLPSRPLSYRSTDSGWEIIQDANRARQLEDTLARLERPERAVSRASRRGDL